jgi:glycosyltransferase involved in cell wall biosynthesis
MTAKEFLKDLDFYVHYPHEKYIEEFGRGVMEAMALGIPPVLPPRFKETFGDAATYATPVEVSKVISSLWVSQERYQECAEAARNFVIERCSLATFPERLEALIKSTEIGRGGSARCTADPSTVAGR